MNNPLDGDEHIVFRTMRDQIATTPMLPAQQRHPALSRPWMLAGASTGITAIAATLVLAFAGASSPPAFAVTTNPDGTTITLNALSAVNALNAKLTAAGVHVRVAPVVTGCNDPVQIAGSDGTAATLQTKSQTWAASIQLSATNDPGSSAPGLTDVPAGQTLVLAASTAGLQAVGQIDQGAAPTCVAPAGA